MSNKPAMLPESAGIALATGQLIFGSPPPDDGTALEGLAAMCL